jgi:hypothetical protein
MPAPIATAMQQLARARFKAFAIELPTGWAKTQVELAPHLPSALTQPERSHTPDPSALFVCKSTISHHVKTQREMSSTMGTFLDAACGAICNAWSMWQAGVSIAGIVINGPTAVGGTVAGPPWTPLLALSLPSGTPMMKAYSTAISQTLGTAWLQYQSSWVLPGLAFWPAFISIATGVAPPTPNVPFPLTAVVQVTAPLAAATLSKQMSALFTAQMTAMGKNPKGAHADELFASVADAFEKSFTAWQATTLVTNVLGTGPAPAPFGPVVGGVGVMAPGGLV